MTKNIRTQIGKVIGKTLNSYHTRVKPVIDDIKFKEQYQGRIIDCMVGEVDDNYIETPETDSAIVKLEHSKEGLVKVPSIKGKTILVDSDGNETDTPAEGCRLVSVGEEEDNKLIILSNNKNLFDGELELGSLSTSHGGNVSHAGCLRSKNYIKVKPNTQYTQSNNLGYSSVINVYDKNKNLLEYLGNKTTFTIPQNGEYIRFRSSTGTTQNDLNVKYQFEEGSVATSYVEQKQHKTEILLDEPLRKINDNIYDEIVDNKVIYNTKKRVLNGSENWYEVTNSPNPQINTKLFILSLPHNSFKSTNFKSSCFNFVNAWMQDIEGMQLENQKDIRINISREKLGDKTINQWLSENPIELIYVPSEPIIEELPNGITLQGFDDTTMYIENEITPTISYGYNALIPYKEELKTQKEEVETNTLDIENNIIPYLMDMEFNLMLMEDNE